MQRVRILRVVAYGIDHQWQADLVDLAKLFSYNKGFKYLLTCIDVLSRYAWVVPLKVLVRMESEKSQEFTSQHFTLTKTYIYNSTKFHKILSSSF
jgi:hypothetical protein